MALLEWSPVDLTSDPDEARYEGDPADLTELLDAASFVAAILHRPAWQTKAACRGKGPEPWFPSRGQSIAPARAICDSCPVKNECLASSLEISTAFDSGIWAGTSTRERKRLRRTIDDTGPRCVDCDGPCTKTRCLDCHNAWALAQMSPRSAA